MVFYRSGVSLYITRSVLPFTDKLLHVLYDDGCFSSENKTCDQKQLLLSCLPEFATDVDWKTFTIWTNNETLAHICSL